MVTDVEKKSNRRISPSKKHQSISMNNVYLFMYINVSAIAELLCTVIRAVAPAKIFFSTKSVGYSGALFASNKESNFLPKIIITDKFRSEYKLVVILYTVVVFFIRVVKEEI